MKRLLDFSIAFLALIFFGPLLCITALLVYANLGRPIFFRQVRIGRNESRFEIIKFRSMNNMIYLNGFVVPDYERLSKFGAWLRATSLDELPELWNVIRGDMSLVGPRPLLEEYLPLYNAEQCRRHEVLPGITGWAQVKGRNSISWEEKFKLDVWYVDNHSLWLDLTILALTVKQVFLRHGVSAPGEATMSKFKGNN